MLYHFIDGGIVVAKFVFAVEGHEIYPVGTDVLAYFAKLVEGFVAGKYQTYEPWEGAWQRYESGENTDVDFTKWFHNLYRPNHRPYDPKEIKLIKEFCQSADEE